MEPSSEHSSRENGESHRGWRLHTHFEIDRHVPIRIDVTPGSNSGKNDEKNRLRAAIAPDHCYVMDRWYAQYLLWNEIVAAKSSYVCRIRDNSDLEDVVEERIVSEAALKTGVFRDIVVNLGTRGKPDSRPNHAVREIFIKVTPHKKRGAARGRRRDRQATASFASPPIFWMFPRRSSRIFSSIGGQSKFSSACSNTYWDVDIYCVRIKTGLRFSRTARSSPVS